MRIHWNRPEWSRKHTWTHSEQTLLWLVHRFQANGWNELFSRGMGELGISQVQCFLRGLRESKRLNLNLFFKEWFYKFSWSVPQSSAIAVRWCNPLSCFSTTQVILLKAQRHFWCFWLSKEWFSPYRLVLYCTIVYKNNPVYLF